nr:hypothetical protein [uncultured Rhodopila sp.]
MTQTATMERPQSKRMEPAKTENSPPKTDPKLTDSTVARALELVKAGKIDYSSTVPAKGAHAWARDDERKRLEDSGLPADDVQVALAKFDKAPEHDDALAIFTQAGNVAATAVAAGLKGDAAAAHQKIHDAITGKPQVGEPVWFIPQLPPSMASDPANHLAGFITGVNDKGLVNIAYFDRFAFHMRAVSVPFGGDVKPKVSWYRR